MIGISGIKMKTFNAYTTSENAHFSLELPTNSITWHPYLEHVSALSVFNLSWSNKIVHIKEISITPISVNTQSANSSSELRTISALVWWTNIDAIKMDSTSPSLPAQVAIRSKPTSISLTNSAIAKHLSAPTVHMTRTMGYFGKNGNSLLSNLHKWKASDFQKITLREWQWIALSPTWSLNNVHYRMEVTIKVGSATYFIPCESAIDNWPFFALLNGAWSGIVIEIVNIDLYESWTDEIPLFSVETIDGLDWGETIQQTSFWWDSLNSSIIIRKNWIVKTEGYNSGAFIAIPRKMPSLGITSPNWPWLTSLWWLLGFKQWKHLDASYPERDIILREWKGIGIIQRNAGKLTNYQLSITFLQEDIESGWSTGWLKTFIIGSSIIPN